jgi:hypothetical protein
MEEDIMSGREKQELRVKDILDYFGEFLSKEQAENMLRRVGGVIDFDTMNRVRNILKEQGHDVPFRSVYRRAK